ncbi:MAG: RDD family protein [Candidatus Izimaplasma sp.]|nr:RDD family protein [Candidatus Izimaplasma bacterium]
MKNKCLKLRYKLSVLIDYSLVWIIVSLPFNDGSVSETIQYFPLFVLLIIFIMFEDYFFFNASIGKRIMFIKLANLKGEKRITLMNVFIRRILEWFYFIWIFVKIDFNSVSGTIIVEHNFKYKTEKSKSSNSFDNKQDLRIQRINALMIDLLIISPIIIFNQFWNSKIFVIDIERPWLFFIGIFSFFIPVIYFILRDKFQEIRVLEKVIRE